MVIVYELDGANGADSDCTPALGNNEKALLTRTDTTDVTRDVPTSTVDELSVAWTSEPNNPNVADWTLGDYTASINVSAKESPQLEFKFQLHRTNSGCTSQETLGTSGAQLGTGVITFTVNVDPAAGAATDRYQLILLGTNNDSHQPRLFTWAIDADGFIEVPFDAPVVGFPHSQAVIVG